MNSSDSELH